MPQPSTPLHTCSCVSYSWFTCHHTPWPSGKPAGDPPSSPSSSPSSSTLWSNQFSDCSSPLYLDTLSTHHPSVYVYVCSRVRMCVLLCVCLPECVYPFMCTHMCMLLCTYISMNVYVHSCVHIRVCSYVCVFASLCMCVSHRGGLRTVCLLPRGQIPGVSMQEGLL